MSSASSLILVDTTLSFAANRYGSESSVPCASRHDVPLSHSAAEVQGYLSRRLNYTHLCSHRHAHDMLGLLI
ncbi:hypothetical protein DAEQUDRAFT_729421 [Daedalea quercina L-15889]|uniref:Uncharacterized protein n=1 Tax=Daedalea quercina L-15889 TaxID=1314783 RepID=A0A165NNM3_9APHY|nr:hypothetical protein DAEQUDRAFT_729421 [Daedalea quercina L-15889]